MITRSFFVPLCLCGFLLLAVAAQAKDYERDFCAEPDALWDAAVVVAKEHYTIVTIEEQQKLFTFSTGYSLTSSGYQVTARVEKAKKGARLILRPAKRQQLFGWGAGGRIAKKFFNQVEQELKKEPDDD